MSGLATSREQQRNKILVRKNYQALKLEADAQSQRQSEPRSKYDICAGLGGHILAALPKNHSPPKNNAKKKKKTGFGNHFRDLVMSGTDIPDHVLWE